MAGTLAPGQSVARIAKTLIPAVPVPGQPVTTTLVAGTPVAKTHMTGVVPSGLPVAGTFLSGTPVAETLMTWTSSPRQAVAGTAKTLMTRVPAPGQTMAGTELGELAAATYVTKMPVIRVSAKRKTILKSVGFQWNSETDLSFRAVKAAILNNVCYGDDVGGGLRVSQMPRLEWLAWLLTWLLEFVGLGIWLP